MIFIVIIIKIDLLGFVFSLTWYTKQFFLTLACIKIITRLKNIYLNHVHLWFVVVVVVVAVWLLADVFFDPGDAADDDDDASRFWLLLFICAVLLTGTAVTTAVGRVTGFACLLLVGCFLICSSKAVRKNEIVVSWCFSCVSQFRFDFFWCLPKKKH